MRPSVDRELPPRGQRNQRTSQIGLQDDYGLLDQLLRGLHRALRENRVIDVDRRAGPHRERDRVGWPGVDLDPLGPALEIKRRVENATDLCRLAEGDEPGDPNTRDAHAELLERRDEEIVGERAFALVSRQSIPDR